MIKKFKWLPQLEVEKLLDCKRVKLWKLRRDGKLQYSKIGNQTYYFLPSIEKLLISNSSLDDDTILSLKMNNIEK